jgi:nicotinamidase-related amidase
VPNAAALASAFREHDLPVVLVNVTGRAPGRTDADSGGSDDSPGTLAGGWADIIDELERQPGDHLIMKRRRSAFHDTGLNTLTRPRRHPDRARRRLHQRRRRINRTFRP